MADYPFPPVYNFPYNVMGRAEEAALIYTMENGLEQRRWRNPNKKVLREITLTYSALTEDDMNTLWDFYLNVGLVEAFNFTDFETDEVIKCRFKDNMTKEEFMYRLYNTGVTLLEVVL
jgi:hypothetical protein